MEMEEITSVQVYPLTGFNNLKAMASVNYRGVVLRGIKLMEKDGTLWMGMPSRKRGERWEDIFFFPDQELRKRIMDAVIKQYEKILKDERDEAYAV